jgi:hypothetical protein
VEETTMMRRRARASAGRVTVTTSDAADGRYTWEVSPTPTAETTLVVFQNESKDPHELIFARLGEGYTVDEAYELQGEKGSATQVMRNTSGAPGNRTAGGQAGSPTGEIADVTKPLTPADYVMLCPIDGNAAVTGNAGSATRFNRVS